MRTKRNLVIFLVILSAFLIFPPKTFAHPGRTDANGGHTCRTNCASWGLGQGEYHYHGGGGSSAGGSTGDSYAAPVQEVVALPTNTPFPTRIPTRIATRAPTKIPTPTVTIAISLTPTPTVEPTKETRPVQSNVKAHKQQGFFDWLFSLFGFSQ